MRTEKTNFELYLGNYKNDVDNTIKKIAADKVIERIWEKDYTLWSDKPDEITNRLGWLKSPEVTLAALMEINVFVEQVKADGFTSALLLGMGGSSLAPEVFSLIFGTWQGFLDLHVLDSTDPGAVLEFDRKLDPAKTLFIVSTKSGGTVETFSFMKYFYNKTLQKVGKEKVGNHFVAITDPGSGLVDTANQLKFRKIFLNDPNIGGRYSALSFFGMVPAALIGMDIKQLLDRAMMIAADPRTGAELGAVMGELAEQGRDKVTFITPSNVVFFGAWVEQLIAESTGKNGKGILPVEGEELLAPEYYSNDRLFVYMHRNGDTSVDAKVEALKKAGHPVVEIILSDLYDFGKEFFRWEIATAVAGWRIGIQPFDQPNVESAKKLARKMVDAYKSAGKLPDESPAFTDAGITVYGKTESRNISDTLTKFLARTQTNNKPRSYVSLQAYVKPDTDTRVALRRLRAKIQEKYKVAVTVGYGPRFLHSTGQLHKGDAGNGLFIQFTSEMPEDAKIPDEAGSDKSSISFGVLKEAQALGDRQALLDNKREVLKFALGKNVADHINKIASMI